MSTKAATPSVFDPAILLPALRDALVKLDPRQLVRNPVIFVTEVVALVVTLLWVQELVTGIGAPAFSGQIAAWLWFTVLFANFAEAVAEGRGKAQAESLKRGKADLFAKKLLHPADEADTASEVIPATALKVGDIVLVEAGDIIPGDGEVISGVASVNESAITGESAPVIRENGGDRSAVTGGTQIISDWLRIRITTKPGESFVDRMIGLIEGANRQKTPNEIALSILLSGLTLVFLIAVVTLYGLALYSGTDLSLAVLAALLVTLIPTTIGGLLSFSGGALNVGDAIRDVVGPLGQATELLEHGRAVCVGGGVGTAVMLPLVQGLARNGVRVTSIIGGRSREWVILEDELRRYGEVITCTDDGSYGRPGFVTQALADVIADGAIDVVYAVGPVPMMRAVAEVNRERLRVHEHFQGPFGFGTPDDAEGWDRVQRGAAGAPELPIMVNRGLAREKPSPEGWATSHITDETGMRAAYAHWKQMMSDD